MDDPVQIKNFLNHLDSVLGSEFIVIGGWAVWAYEQAEMSLDGAAMISNAALSILRDEYEVTNTPKRKNDNLRHLMAMT